MSSNKQIDLARAKCIIEARKSLRDDEVAATEKEVVAAILAPELLAKDAVVRPMGYPAQGYLTPFAATEALACELHRALAGYAANEGLNPPKLSTYHPLFATPTLLSEVWRLRQVVDELGIDYAAYLDIALPFWAAKGHGRLPRPMQLCAADVVGWVLEVWSDPANRHQRPLFVGWDARFYADKYVGHQIQERARALIDERLLDAERFGGDPASELAKFVGPVMTKEEAAERYGAALAETAAAIAASAAVHTGEVELDQALNSL